MTKVEDLMWLYKMAVDYELDAESNWLKEHIEEQLQAVKEPQSRTEFQEERVSPLDTEKIAA
mgnify:CR=1 FL=1